MKRQRKFRPTVSGLEQRLALNASFGHVGELGGSLAHTAVIDAKVHHSGGSHHHSTGGHHSTGSHHSGSHGKSHVMAVVDAAHKTTHHKTTHHKTTTHKHH